MEKGPKLIISIGVFFFFFLSSGRALAINVAFKRTCVGFHKESEERIHTHLKINKKITTTKGKEKEIKDVLGVKAIN